MLRKLLRLSPLAREVAKTVVEAGFALLIPVGIGMFCLPAGLIAGGVLGVLACELAELKERKPERGRQ